MMHSQENQNGLNVCMSLSCLEDYHYLSFMDLSNTFTAQETHRELLDCYQDIALLKSLYWRMLPTFRFLISIIVASETPIYEMVKHLASIESDD